MKKSCSNCYWNFLMDENYCSHSDKKPSERICEEYSPKCDLCEKEAFYKYRGGLCCTEHLLKRVGVEKYYVAHFELNGKELGDDTDMNKVIENLLDEEDIEALE